MLDNIFTSWNYKVNISFYRLLHEIKFEIKSICSNLSHQSAEQKQLIDVAYISLISLGVETERGRHHGTQHKHLQVSIVLDTATSMLVFVKIQDLVSKNYIFTCHGWMTLHKRVQDSHYFGIGDELQQEEDVTVFHSFKPKVEKTFMNTNR